MSWRGASEFVWWRVVAQIGAVQTGFWLLLALSVLLLDLALALPLADLPKQMFDWRCCFRFDSVRAYVTMISFVVTSVSSCGVLLLVVGRAKKCLDFCSTMYLYHMLVVFCLSGIPRSVLWWVLIVLGVVISTVCSELVCLRREMREIPVSSGSSFIV